MSPSQFRKERACLRHVVRQGNPVSNQTNRLARIPRGLHKTVAPASRPAVLRASRPSGPSPDHQLSVFAPLVRNAG